MLVSTHGRRGGVREDLATREPVTCKHSDFIKKSSLSLHSELLMRFFFFFFFFFLLVSLASCLFFR